MAEEIAFNLSQKGQAERVNVYRWKRASTCGPKASLTA